MLLIRAAETADESGIFELISELEEERLDRDPFSEVYLANLMLSYVYYYIAEENGRALGFVSVHIQKLLHHAAAIAEVQELVVTSGARGRGIGKSLLEKAKEEAAENHCARLELSCNRRRTESHAFYEKQGMTNTSYKFCLDL